MRETMTGSKNKPYPIHLTLKGINETLLPQYWTSSIEEGATYESLGLDQRMRNVQKALEDYGDYSGGKLGPINS